MSQKDLYEEKRQKAIEYLGRNWLLHPEYQQNAKHSLIGYQSGRYHSYKTQSENK